MLGLLLPTHCSRPHRWIGSSHQSADRQLGISPSHPSRALRWLPEATRTLATLARPSARRVTRGLPRFCEPEVFSITVGDAVAAWQRLTPASRAADGRCPSSWRRPRWSGDCGPGRWVHRASGSSVRLWPTPAGAIPTPATVAGPRWPRPSLAHVPARPRAGRGQHRRSPPCRCRRQFGTTRRAKGSPANHQPPTDLDEVLIGCSTAGREDVNAPGVSLPASGSSLGTRPHCLDDRAACRLGASVDAPSKGSASE